MLCLGSFRGIGYLAERIASTPLRKPPPTSLSNALSRRYRHSRRDTATRNRVRRRHSLPDLERLESNIALSGISRIAAVLPPLETISGRVTNQVTGRGIGRVKVELIGSASQVVATSVTGP